MHLILYLSFQPHLACQFLPKPTHPGSTWSLNYFVDNNENRRDPILLCYYRHSYKLCQRLFYHRLCSFKREQTYIVKREYKDSSLTDNKLIKSSLIAAGLIVIALLMLIQYRQQACGLYFLAIEFRVISGCQILERKLQCKANKPGLSFE